jgi:HEAT repeat protein
MKKLILCVQLMGWLGACTSSPQSSSEEEFERLIQSLGSDDIAKRTEATEALKRAGTRALPALERAALSTDPEVRLRAQDLLYWARLALGLPGVIRDVVPGATERILEQRERGSTEVLLESLAFIHGVWKPGTGMESKHLVNLILVLGHASEEKPWRIVIGGVSKEDLEPLLLPSFLGARNSFEKMALCAWAGRVRNSSSVPELKKLLRDGDPRVQKTALDALRGLGISDIVPDLIPLMVDRCIALRHAALRALKEFSKDKELPDAVPNLLQLLDDEEDRAIRFAALELAVAIRAREVVARAVRLWDRPEGEIVLSDPETWRRWGGRTLLPQLEALLDDEDPRVRHGAQRVIDLVRALDVPREDRR